MQNLHLNRPFAFQVMIKPTGSNCNLNCTYCYYLEKQKYYPNSNELIEISLLELFIKQHIECQDVPLIQFVWQGGEPTLAGIDFYRNALKIQDKYKGNKRIENILQTNGVLLNDEWCRFLSVNNFLVGISIDGPEHLHNVYRKNKGGKGTWNEVMRGISLLQKYHVEFNTLTTINDVNVKFPAEVYTFLKQIGSRYIQFLPVVERIENFALSLLSDDESAEITPWSVNAIKFGVFLNTIFDIWVRADVGKIFVQHFDVALANWVGEMPGLCVYSEICGDATALEKNGDIYSCDHYVFPEFLLGNITQMNLKLLLSSQQQVQFGTAKKSELPLICIDCEYRFACHGGCPKLRFTKQEGEKKKLNFLCEGYKNFFEHIHPYMQFMAEELGKKCSPANVMVWVRKQDLKEGIVLNSPEIALKKNN